MTCSPAKPKAAGSLALVGAGPGARDLLTLRAVQRLQQADTVFYDRLVEEEVLNLAPPAAKRVFVGKHVGAHSWPQDRINAAVVAEALKGRRVVRLKSGDPSIFGRAAEELAAARAAGIDAEIVPGITAASAAAAQTGTPLTERGVSDTLVLTTARCKAGDPLPDCVRHAKPGTTIVFYMSVGQASRVRDGLLRQGMSPSAPVTIAADVSKPAERTVTCGLSVLPETLELLGISGCAAIIITFPKPGSGQLPLQATPLCQEMAQIGAG
ncbi:uroporphyrinogen-III C-methyltransferase [Leisingera sp. ANG59]|uniref:uroporphyrinogen-III C-methyltransferase n=1 Tax=Leisingera sp. ANG59 TaxID=2675221 RepID=UPI001573094E|nr:uroporphyrinogen-III C-methyltransferase [Leisingera sp. ANG59]NSY37174.1 uroporphyrinogen-III C-methyltransferase [Leisingera sp. ANG59]